MTIPCQDTVFLTMDFDACERELSANYVRLQTPLHVTCGRAARRAFIPSIPVHVLVVEFDETKTTKATVVSILAKYGCWEQQPDAAPLSGSPAYAKQPQNWPSVITMHAA